MKKNLEWFIARIDKTIVAKSPNAFNGEMKVTDEGHAKHLCDVAQEYQGYVFSDPASENTIGHYLKNYDDARKNR